MMDTNIQSDYECNECRALENTIDKQAEQITRLEKESEQCHTQNDNLCTEHIELKHEIKQQAEQITELWDFIIGSDHQAGCSGGFNEKYRCKCGLRELIKKYKAAQPQKGE